MPTFKRVALKSETHRPRVRFQGANYEPLSSPSFIRVGRKVLVQPMIVRKGQEKQICVCHEGSEAWETWEEA